MDLRRIAAASVLGIVFLAPVGAIGEESNGAHATLWTTGDALMPAWGFYPLTQAYGGTKPLGKWAAWCAAGNDGQLTWVAEFPRDGEYQVWVRKYGGYGSEKILVDEQPATDAAGGPGGGQYVWNHAGKITVSSGSHHVDIMASNGMFDAVLFTTNADFKPDKDELPKPLEEVKQRALRNYRHDRHLKGAAGDRGFVVSRATAYEAMLYDVVPGTEDLIARLSMWGAAGQYINGTFAIRAIQDVGKLTVSLQRLTDPGGRRIEESNIDLRVVHVRERKNSLFRGGHKRLLPEILLRDDRTALPPKGEQGGYGGGQCVTQIPAHQSRQFWITVHVPEESPAGLYRGEVSIAGEGTDHVLPVELEVLPIELRPAEGYYAIYHRSQSIDPDRPHYVTPDRYLEELRDHVRHGLNAATLYGGFSTLKLAQQAGMNKAPCLMHWPGSGATQQVAAAKEMGFDDLYYYGVDEPNSPEQIERCRKEAERRQQLGLHMFTAINSAASQRATRDFIDRPVYNIYVFGGKDNAEAMYVRERGFRPISYWVSATAYPLPYRALTGLYNKACGYLGSSPWSYQDYPGDRLYDPDNPAHKVAYPDESGKPIPTLAWEAHRAGIDDVRYLEALDRATAAAEARMEQADPPGNLSAALERARAVRKEHYESISGRWFAYLCRIKPGDLEKTRRALADATVELTAALTE